MISFLGMLALAILPPAAGQGLVIDGATIDGDGILSFRCTFSFSSPQRIYSWRSSLQPAVGRIVFVEVRDDHHREVRVERVAGFDPLFPDPQDVVMATKISFTKPIRMVAQPGPKLKGCFQVRVRYDTSSLEEKHRRRAGLDSVSVESDFVHVCSP